MVYRYYYNTRSKTGKEIKVYEVDENKEEEEEEIMAPSTASTITPMNVWARSGLDLTDSTFSKIYYEALKFSETDDFGKPLKKFKLTSDRFEELRSILITKVNKMAMRKLMKVTQDSESYELLDQAPLVTETTLETHRDEIWADTKDPKTTDTQEKVNEIQDKRLKCHALGTWLEAALTKDGLHKLEHAKSKYTVYKDDEPYIHGPYLFWLIVEDIKPNNDTLIQNAKDKLNQLNVKNYGHSVKEMLTEFDNIVVEISSRLKGQISEDEKVSALWKCLATMSDEVFSKIVFDEKRTYRNAKAADKLSCDALIRLFRKEQTNMEADDIWNKPSAKDQQIVALTSILKSVVNNVNNAIASHSTNGGDGKGDHGNGNGRKRGAEPKKSGVPAWKYQRTGDETEMERDGKTWYWCTHHDNPNPGMQGMWVRHKETEHKDDFKPPRYTKGQNGSNGNKNGGKKTSNSGSGGPTVKVDNKLFQALKSGADVQVFLNKLAQNNQTNLN